MLGPRERRRRGVLAATLIAVAMALTGMSLDAARRRSADASGRAARVELAAAMGLSDLALSSSSRWVRHPSVVEPAAAISDVPGALDADPAGGAVTPRARRDGEASR